MNIIGTSGPDLLKGTNNNDRIAGLGDDDALYGKRGGDELSGDTGGDALYGGRGADYLFGNAGDDYLSGGRGNDWVNGGSGSDFLSGGKGKDTFAFIFGGPLGEPGDSTDTISDFNAKKDKLFIVSGAADTASAIYDAETGHVTLSIGSDAYNIATMAKGLDGVDIILS